MLNTDEYLELCEIIGDEILNLPVCQTYKALQQELSRNPELVALVQVFEDAKSKYDDVERYGGKYHPDYKMVSNQLSEAKTNLYTNPKVKALKECEREIQTILDEIALVMNTAIEFKGTIVKSDGCGCSGKCSR